MLARVLSFSLALAAFTMSACGNGNGTKVQDASVADLSGDMTNPCQTTGGTCTDVGSCGPGQGYLSSLGGLVGCGSVTADAVCCYATCSGTPVEFGCCADATVFRPDCNATTKTLECPTGTTECASVDM